jgi:hypothetical protein
MSIAAYVCIVGEFHLGQGMMLSANARYTTSLLRLSEVGEFHAAFLKVVTGVADPRGMKRHSAEGATNLRVPHPSRILRRVGSTALSLQPSVPLCMKEWNG